MMAKYYYLIFFIPLMISLSSCKNEISGTVRKTTLDGVAPNPPQVDPPVVVTPPICHKKLKQLAIYYSYPGSLNLYYSPPVAAADFDQYDVVVWGNGIENTGHGAHAGAVAVLAALPPASLTKIYGYIMIGDDPLNPGDTPLLFSEIQTRVDNWALMGVGGILLDGFGFDFKLSGNTDTQFRARQIAIVNYVHSKGLNVFMNAWDSDDVYSKENTTPIPFVAGDKYLIESYTIGYNAFGQLSFADHLTRMAKIKAHKLDHPIVEQWAIPTVASVGAWSQTKFDFISYMAMYDDLEGVGWSEPNFSTDGGGANEALMPFRTMPTLSKDFCEVTGATVDQTAKTVEFLNNSLTYLLQYDDLGSHTFSAQ